MVKPGYGAAGGGATSGDYVGFTPTPLPNSYGVFRAVFGSVSDMAAATGYIAGNAPAGDVDREVLVLDPLSIWIVTSITSGVPSFSPVADASGSIDGGSPSDVYLVSQIIDGGTP